MNQFLKVSFEQYKKDRLAIANMPLTEETIRTEYDNLKIPVRATRHSAGYDFFAPFPFELKPGESITFPTGIRVKLDPDKFLGIYPRSGLGFKYRLQLDNTVGIADADYIFSDNEGHLMMRLTNDSKEGKILHVTAGQAVAQGIIQLYCLASDDNVTQTRNGGFGSTDKS